MSGAIVISSSVLVFGSTGMRSKCSNTRFCNISYCIVALRVYSFIALFILTESLNQSPVKQDSLKENLPGVVTMLGHIWLLLGHILLCVSSVQ